MEFLDPKQKKAHKQRLYVGYALMAVLIAIATWLLASFSFGFYYDAKTGSIVQNGLVFVDAHPESAHVLINGQDKGSTDVRLILPEGSYNVKLEREGYRTWNHDFLLAGGKIERLVYPFLFPNELISSDANLFASQPTFASQSPDRRWLVTKQATLNEFSVMDLNAKTIEPVPIVLDSSVIHQAGAKHEFKAVEWSTDNRHLLLRHSFEGGVEFIVFDRNKAAGAVNLNTAFGRTMTEARLRDKKYDHYYFHDVVSGDLVTAQLSNKQVVAVASNVINFQPHGNNMLLCIMKRTSNIEATLIDAGKQHKLRDLPKSSKYVLDLAQFNGKWYIVFGASDEKKAYVYINPLDQLKKENQPLPLPSALLQLDKPVDYVSFSANTRFIAAQAGASFAVYDAENVRQYKYDTKLSLPKGYEVKWMDGHRMNAVVKGKMVVWDFDNTNQQTLVSMNDQFYPFFNRDYDKLFTIGSSSSVKQKNSLVLTPLIYKPKTVTN